jgi:Multicopper oxidase
MHLHGHDFFVLGEGRGIFSESDLKTANLINPTRRDVKTMPVSDPPTGNNTGGFIIIAFKLNNPGTWVVPSSVWSLIYAAASLSYCMAYLSGFGYTIC